MTHYENIPNELKKLKQWVCTYNDSKIPMKAFTNEAASSIESTTWAMFDTANYAVSNGLYDYCGFVFADNGYVGIDIDNGYDEDGFISPIAADIINKCTSYTEKSRSGRGFHILIKGTLPFTGRNNLNGVEIYKSARYFIMTGNIMIYNTIKENQQAIDYVVNKYFKQTTRKNEVSEYKERIYSPIWELPNNNKIKLRPTYPKIPSGSRNICLTSLAGVLHNQGYSRCQIYDELVYCNKTACDPPICTKEIRTIVNSVTRYER